MKTKENMQKTLSTKVEKKEVEARNPLPIAKDIYYVLYPYFDGKSLANLEACSRFFRNHITEKEWQLRVNKDVSARPLLLTLETLRTKQKKTETYKAFYNRAALLQKEIEAVTKPIKTDDLKKFEESKKKKEALNTLDTLNTLTMKAIALNWDCEKFSKLVPPMIFSPKNIKNFKTEIIGTTFLHEAARVGSEEFVGFLLSKKANVGSLEKGLFVAYNTTGMTNGGGVSSGLSTSMRVTCHWLENWGKTPLMRAAEEGHIKCVQLLLKNRANINYECTAKHNTALHLAAQEGHYECTAFLIENGASMTKKNKEKDIPWECARDSGKEQCAILIEGFMRERNLELPSTNPFVRFVKNLF